MIVIALMAGLGLFGLSHGESDEHFIVPLPRRPVPPVVGRHRRPFRFVVVDNNVLHGMATVISVRRGSNAGVWLPTSVSRPPRLGCPRPVQHHHNSDSFLKTKQRMADEVTPS